MSDCIFKQLTMNIALPKVTVLLQLPASHIIHCLANDIKCTVTDVM